MNQFYVEILKQRKREGGMVRYNAVVGYLPIIAENSDTAEEIATKILDNCNSIWVGEVKVDIKTGL